MKESKLSASWSELVRHSVLSMTASGQSRTKIDPFTIGNIQGGRLEPSLYRALLRKLGADGLGASFHLFRFQLAVRRHSLRQRTEIRPEHGKFVISMGWTPAASSHCGPAPDTPWIVDSHCDPGRVGPLLPSWQYGTDLMRGHLE